MSKPYAYRVIIQGQVYVYSYQEPENDRPVICMSSPKRDIYRIVLDHDKSVCSCPAFTFRRHPSYQCKHISSFYEKNRQVTSPS